MCVVVVHMTCLFENRFSTYHLTFIFVQKTLKIYINKFTVCYLATNHILQHKGYIHAGSH